MSDPNEQDANELLARLSEALDELQRAFGTLVQTDAFRGLVGGAVAGSASTPPPAEGARDAVPLTAQEQQRMWAQLRTLQEEISQLEDALETLTTDLPRRSPPARPD
jgi:hypothetical protein